MKNPFISVILFCVLVGCSKEKTVHIRGTLNGSSGESVYLHELGRSEKNAVKDSAKLDSGGNFSFKYKISQPTFYSITINKRGISILAKPKEKITISGDARHLPLTYSVEGSEDSKHIRRLSQRLEHTVFVGDSLNKTLQSFIDNRNFVNIQRQLEWNFINEVDSLRAYNIRFINNNPNSLVIIYALYQQLEPNIFLFSREEDIKYFRTADSLFFKRYPKVPYVNLLHSNVLELNEQHRVKQLNRLFSLMGQNAPEIALQSPEGKTVKLSSYKGQYVLLDFWASWSAPCRAENKNLVQIYNKFRNKGFNIFQVSLDQSKSSWERAIKEDELTWTHGSDLKFWDSEIVKAYGVETIPANFLIDKDGTVIARGLQGEFLDKRLSEIFAANE